MDRKSIAVLVVSFILLLTWPLIVNRLYPPKPVPPKPATAQIVTNPPGTNLPLAEVTAAPTNLPPATAPTVSRIPEELVALENAEARWTFTSHGGGLKEVELKAYPETVACWGKQASTNNFASLETGAPLPVLALTGSQSAQGDGIFKLTRNADRVRAEKSLPNGLVLVKEFQLLSNYLVSAAVRLENGSAQALNLGSLEWIVGTATPLDPKDDGSLLGVFWYNGRSSDNVTPSWFANRTLGCFPGTPREQYSAGQNNVNWTAVHNQFFALAVMPPTNVMANQLIVRPITLPPIRTTPPTAADAQVAGRAWLLREDDISDASALAVRLRNAPDSLADYLKKQLSPETQRLLSENGGAGSVPQPLLKGLVDDLNKVLRGPSLYEANRGYFSRAALSAGTRRLLDECLWSEDVVRANRLVLDEAFTREIRKSPIGYQARVIYPPASLTAGQSLEHHFLIYAGPKEYKTLSRLASDLKNNVDVVMEYGGFFGWFAQLLLLSMNAIHGLGLDYGSAIIVITILIKIVFWPLTNLSTRSMKRMAALQPQMKALQEKYKEDPQKMQRKMMEFYKEHKINPASGCLPVLVQMPIFFGFYQMIRSAIELRGARFLWNCDLSKPDTLFVIPGLNVPFNLLPLLMGVTMIWQARLTPASPSVDATQQKMMKYMPLIFFVILYNFSAGLTLYWTVQNLLSIAQMKLTRAKDEAAKAAGMPTPVTPVHKKRK